MRIETATIKRLRDALLQSGRRQEVVVTSAYETLTREGLLSDEELKAIERVAPLGETMFLMMAADGELAGAELDAVRGALLGLTGEVVHVGTINVMLERYRASLDEDGREARLQKIADVIKEDQSQAEGAFALAAAVAIADDEVAEAEQQLIQQLAELFGIGDDRAEAILHQLQDDAAEQPPLSARLTAAANKSE